MGGGGGGGGGESSPVAKGEYGVDGRREGRCRARTGENVST